MCAEKDLVLLSRASGKMAFEKRERNSKKEMEIIFFFFFCWHFNLFQKPPFRLKLVCKETFYVPQVQECNLVLIDTLFYVSLWQFVYSLDFFSYSHFLPLIFRGVKIACKIPNRALQKECAEILETMKVCEKTLLNFY